jgi:hypothetical protein
VAAEQGFRLLGFPGPGRVGPGAGRVVEQRPAEEAIEDLYRTMADLLDRMAAGLGSGSVRDSARDWLAQARSLGGEIGRVDDALRQAEESTKLNPRSLRLPHSTITLRESLETLEHAAVTLRVFARSLVDSTRLAEDNPLADPDVRRRMADVLRELSAAVRTYGSLATEFDASSHDLLESELERHLAARTMIRIGSASYWAPTRRPGRSGGRYGAS